MKHLILGHHAISQTFYRLVAILPGRHIIIQQTTFSARLVTNRISNYGN